MMALPSRTVTVKARRLGGITAAGRTGTSCRNRAVPSVSKAVLRAMGSRRSLPYAAGMDTSKASSSRACSKLERALPSYCSKASAINWTRLGKDRTLS